MWARSKGQGTKEGDTHDEDLYPARGKVRKRPKKKACVPRGYRPAAVC